MASYSGVLAIRVRSLAVRNTRGRVVVEPISDDIDKVPEIAENFFLDQLSKSIAHPPFPWSVHLLIWSSFPFRNIALNTVPNKYFCCC